MHTKNFGAYFCGEADKNRDKNCLELALGKFLSPTLKGGNSDYVKKFFGSL